MNFDGVKICGVSDHLGDAACKWPMLDVSLHASGDLGGVNLADAAAFAIKAWNDACGLRLTLTINPRTANILVGSGRIDGRNGVLAQSELPCGFSSQFMRQVNQLYDTGEVWTLAANPPAGKIDLGRVMAHELGHAIGIGHINDGNLMAPTYSSTIALPQRGDVAEARSRYGLPAAPPVPGPAPGPAPTGAPFRTLEIVDTSGTRWIYEPRRV